VNGLFAQVGLQILWAILEPLIFSGIAVVVGIVGRQIYKWTGYQIEAQHASNLQRALENGVRVGMHHFGPGARGGQTEQAILSEATNYVRATVPDAVKHFRLSDETIKRLATAKLPGSAGR
jgi:hypothetical protein